MNKNIFSVRRASFVPTTEVTEVAAAAPKKGKNFGEVFSKIIGQAKHLLHQSDQQLISKDTPVQNDYTGDIIRLCSMDNFNADFVAADLLIIEDCGAVDLKKVKAKVVFIHNVERLYIGDCRATNIAGMAIGTVGFGNLRVFELAAIQSMTTLVVEDILSAEACYFASNIVQLNESAVDVQKMMLWGHQLRNYKGKELKYTTKDQQRHEEAAMVDVEKLSQDIESLLGVEGFFDTVENKEVVLTEEQVGVFAAFGMAHNIVNFFYGGPKKMAESSIATGMAVSVACDMIKKPEEKIALSDEEKCVHILSTIEKLDMAVPMMEVSADMLHTPAPAAAPEAAAAPVVGTGSKATKIGAGTEKKQ